MEMDTESGNGHGKWKNLAHAQNVHHSVPHGFSPELAVSRSPFTLRTIAAVEEDPLQLVRVLLAWSVLVPEAIP